VVEAVEGRPLVVPGGGSVRRLRRRRREEVVGKRRAVTGAAFTVTVASALMTSCGEVTRVNARVIFALVTIGNE